MDKVVVGVFGNAGHGKSTLARSLVRHANAHWLLARDLALADSLKRVAMELLGMPHEVAFGTDGFEAEREARRKSWVKYGRNGRQWLQWIGTELGRQQVDRDLWVSRTVEIIAAESTYSFFAISDCRFHNELTGLAERLSAIGARFVPIRVLRPSVPVDTSHASEHEVTTMDETCFYTTIMNEGTTNDLYVAAGEVVAQILGPAK